MLLATSDAIWVQPMARTGSTGSKEQPQALQSMKARPVSPAVDGPREQKSPRCTTIVGVGGDPFGLPTPSGTCLYHNMTTLDRKQSTEQLIAPDAEPVAAAHEPKPAPVVKVEEGEVSQRCSVEPEPAPADFDYDTHDSVLRVFSTESQFNYGQPWTTLRQGTTSGTAFACNWNGQRLLLTCAHVVRDAVLVELRKPNCHRKYTVRVQCVGLECDLALLELVNGGNEDFWHGVPLAELSSSLPNLGDEVTCVGFPTGGDNLCITQGVVSRIDMQGYPTSARQLLVVQIDAAINPGNSGGPVLDSRGVCAGIAFQALNDTENIGYIIPACGVIDHFLLNYSQHGEYTGFGDCGFSLLHLENTHMRRMMGLEGEKDGAMVHKIHKATPAAKVLQQGDMLLSFDGKRVGQDGRVSFRDKSRIDVNFLATQKFVGDKCELVIMRGGREMQVELELSLMDWLVTMDPPKPPEYFSIGGLVFTVLTEPFLQHRFGRRYQIVAPTRLATPWMTYARREFDGHQIVVLVEVLADELTQGLTRTANKRVSKLNGEEVKNLRHLIDMVDACTGEWLCFELEDEEPLALPTAQAKAATAAVLSRNMIPSDRSVQYRSQQGS